MVRELAEYDYDRYQAVLRWPVREAFEAMVYRIQQKAFEAHRHEQLMWALLAPHSKKQQKPPELPPILKN